MIVCFSQIAGGWWLSRWSAREEALTGQSSTDLVSRTGGDEPFILGINSVAAVSFDQMIEN